MLAVLVLAGAGTSDPAPAGTWRRIPAAPGAADGAPVWTGAELVLWSGRERSAEGVAFSPTADRWREVAPSPLVPRHSHSGVWTGAEVVYWGGTDAAGNVLADGAAYDPTVDRWRTIATAPLPGRSAHEAVWTGTEMVVWGGFTKGCCYDSVIHAAEAAAYDPVADRWRRLPDVPPPWSGDDGAALTGVVDGRVLVWRDGRLAALDTAAGRWRDLGAPPPIDAADLECMMSNGPKAAGAFTATGLVAWLGGCEAVDGIAYDVGTRRWSSLGRAPAGGLDGVVATPRLFAQLALWPPPDIGERREPRLLRYDEADRRWRRMVGAPGGAFGHHATLAWTGEELLVWGGFSESVPVRTGALFRPHAD